MVLEQERGRNSPLDRVLSLYSIQECSPNKLITEYSTEKDEVLKKRYSRRLGLPPSIFMVVFIFIIGFLGLALSGIVSPLYYAVAVAIPVVLGLLAYYVFLPGMLPNKFSRIEVNKIDREVRVTVVSAAGKERHVTAPFERILRVIVILYAKPEMIELGIDLKPGNSLKERWKDGFDYRYRLYLGQPHEGISDFKKYIRELFLHVQIDEIVDQEVVVLGKRGLIMIGYKQMKS